MTLAQTDQQTVADLDSEYQDAVGRNDAATMDRILSDDFVLVSGMGKTSTKADFISEARSGEFVYERQEDSERKVRVRPRQVEVDGPAGHMLPEFYLHFAWTIFRGFQHPAKAL